MHLPIICFDMDGTLLDSRGRIHPNDVALLASENRPALFIPSTGRPLESLKRALARNGLYQGQSLPFPLVLLNGSLLHDKQETRLAFHPLDEAVQRELIALAMRFPHITFWFLGETDIFVLWPTPLSDSMAEGFDFSMRPLSDADGGARFSKIMCVSESPSALQEFGQAATSLPIEVALSLPTVLELTLRSIDKGSGVSELFQYMGMSAESFYAAGDGENDLPLFRVARRSFAPATAPHNIKAAASQVIDVAQEGLLAPILKLAA